ncbi:type III secretion system chaperone [Ottowia thiooxydans]|uniref:Type III secretion system chaperone n=1 Tax=Ottowia thiooxydans TaxID=219182 RepID=A0ABV2QHE3_9BURK
MSSFGSVLSSFGEKLGIQGLAFDQDGCCRLVFDGQKMFELRTSSAQGRMLLSSRVGRSGSPWPDATGRLLLQANLWGAGAGGGWFSQDDQGQIYLQHEVSLSEDSASQMLAKVEGMLSSLEVWERRLSEQTSDQASQLQRHVMQRV